MFKIKLRRKKKEKSLFEKAKSVGEYVTKELKKSDHEKIWAFKKEEVKIGCVSGLFCVAEIDGEVFALNGNAEMKFKIKSVHDAGKAIQGKSIGGFIAMALKLK
jgi:hypothetical protein